MNHSRRFRLLSIAFSIVPLCFGPARAEVLLAPGEEFEFAQADSCGHATEVPNVIKALAGADSSCSAAARRIKAEVKPIVGAEWVGLRTVQASAFLRNDFAVTGDAATLGNSVGAWVTYDVDFKGRVVFIGFFSNPTVELAMTLTDLTEGKAIKGEAIWSRDGSGFGVSIPYIPIDFNFGGGTDAHAVTNTFATVLTRGHEYRLELKLVCSVFSDGGLDVGSACDYMDSFLGDSGGGAGWSRLAVKVGLDEAVVLAKLAEIDELRELFLGHTHSYLTGKGVGHNNTVAETTPPLGTDDPEPPPTPAADAGRDVGRSTKGGRHKAGKD